PRSRRTLDRRRHAALQRKQLRNAAHDRDLRADPGKAPRPDAVPAEECAACDRIECGGGGIVSDDPTTNALAAGGLSADEAHRELLSSVAETARAIFGAKAASIFLYDERTDELVFEAVAGSGAETLIGRRFPSSSGIAGWVLVTRQPLVIEDVTADPRFAKDVAEDTGYVPKGIMAGPFLREDRSLGVLEVLDRPAQAAFTLAEMDLWGCLRTRPRSRST